MATYERTQFTQHTHRNNGVTYSITGEYYLNDKGEERHVYTATDPRKAVALVRRCASRLSAQTLHNMRHALNRLALEYWTEEAPAAEEAPLPFMPLEAKPYQREEKAWHTTAPAPPAIVCLCGSTRFRAHFEAANLEQTLAGKIVLQPGHYTHSIAPGQGHKEQYFSPEIAAGLEELYRRKIELADEVLVLNVGGYLGSSTRKEIEYALELGKTLAWLEAPPKEYDEAVDPWEEHGHH